MKTRKIAMLATLPAAILAANSAMADMSVYGKANITLNQYEDSADIVNVDYDRQDNSELESNASRIGFKGAETLNDSDLKAIYKMEYATQVDDGSTEFKQRNIYAGLQGNLGSIIAGKFDTPLKTSQKKVDLFNDLPLGDIKNVLVGENRMSNIIQYSTPKMNGFKVSLAIMPGEDDGTASGDDDGIADYSSISISYDTENIYLAIANDSDIDNQDVVRLVGQFKAGNLTLGAITQQAEESDSSSSAGLKDFKGMSFLEDYQTDIVNADSDASGSVDIDDYFFTAGTGYINSASFRTTDQDGYVLSAKYKIGSGALKVQYAYSETEHNLVSTDDIETTMINIGYDYKLSKKTDEIQTKLFAYLSSYSAEMGDIENDRDTLAVGFEAKF